ncbi:hypothetical protein [Achromobacter marplatensis]|uniref:hypothetical protein n=1 Tax=Achromobacter marplatensis TaxID=470868 RepID=UPI0028E8C932|nr:hypothetical protein [Achromobacter marplatensis]
MTAFEALISIAQINIGALSTLAAAFGGAWLAFRFESVRRQKERQDQEAEQFQRIVFLLGMQLNTIEQFSRDALVPHHDKPCRELWIPAVNLPVPLKSFAIEFQGLAPMLKSEYLGFGFAAVIANARAEALATLVDRRESLHVTEYQQQLRLVPPSASDGRTIQEIQDHCDEATLQTLKRYTDEIYEQTESTLEKLDAALELAARVMAAKFKGYEFTVMRRS